MCFMKKIVNCKYYKKYKKYKAKYEAIKNENMVKIENRPALAAQKVKDLCVEKLGDNILSIGRFPDSDTISEITKEDVENVLVHDVTDKFKYISEKFDCDDFSVILLGRVKTHFGSCNFGEIWIVTKEGGGHALNVYASLSENKLYLVEPQTDKWEEYDGQEILYIRF